MNDAVIEYGTHVGNYCNLGGVFQWKPEHTGIIDVKYKTLNRRVNSCLSEWRRKTGDFSR